MKRLAGPFLALALIAGFSPAEAQQFQNIPDHTVMGRLGSGSSSGPAQAIPFATLSAQLTGASITLNSGNGQHAPGTMSGGNTYTFGATTDTPQMTGLGLGGAAPTTGLKVYNAPATPNGSGQAVLGANATYGAGLIGQGSAYDVYLGNNAGTVALGIQTGTENTVLFGGLIAALLPTSGTIAGSICSTSAGVILYKAGVNCYAVSGISVVSGKTLTVDNTLELAGTDGTKFTYPAANDTLAGLGAAQTFTGNNTFSTGTVNFTGTTQINGVSLGSFATQNYATPPAIGGTTPNTATFSTLTTTTPIGLSSGGTNASTAAAARAATGLNVESYTPKGDTNYVILATDRSVGTSATLTAPRTWTLPAASAVNPGAHLIVADMFGGVTNTNTITVTRAGSDTINGGTSVAISVTNGAYEFVSDGVSKWTAQQLGAQATVGVSSINGQTGNPSIVAGTAISVSTAGGNITVANTGAASFNGRTGAVVPTSGDYTYSGNTMALPTKYWSGCTHSNDVGTPNTKVDVAACVARDSTDTVNIVNSSGVIDFTTNGANGLDTGSLAATTLYYTYEIAKAGGAAAALLASASPTSPTLPSTYVYYRRIGALKTDASSHILPFTQVNDHWYYSTPITDVSSVSFTASTTAARTLFSVPAVQGITPLTSVYFHPATGTSAVLSIMPGFLASTAQTGFIYDFEGSSSGAELQVNTIPVDSSGNWKLTPGSVNETVTVIVAGWIDPL